MRIRSIKPEFWRSQDIAGLPRAVRLLFIGLWSYVDDNGVGIDEYRQIAADLFALEDDPVAARGFVRDGLATLSAASLIVRYEHGGKRYLYIPTWDRHQRVDKPAKPRYPRPDQAGATILTCENETSTAEFSTPSRDPRDGFDPGSYYAESDATVIGDITDAGTLTANIQPTSMASRNLAAPQASNLHKHQNSRHPRESLAPGTGEQGNRGTGETDSSSPSARDAREDGRDGTTDPETLTTAAPVPNPGEPTAAPRRPSRSTAGTRLPDPFPVTDTMRQWARTNTPTCGTADHEAFCDYWRSVPGAKGRKLDWEATWRNWMRRAQNDTGRRQPRASPNRNGLVEHDGMLLKPETLADFERTKRFEAMGAKGIPAIGGTT